MATLPTASRNAATDAIVDLVDAGGTGTIEIRTSGGSTLLATLTMSATAFGAASVGVATANAITDDTSADATGTAAEFQLISGGAADVITGTVGTSGSDINFTSVSFTAGDTISITSMTVTVPAS